MPVTYNSVRQQGASALQIAKFRQELESSLKPSSEGGKAITGAEAQRMLSLVQQLPAKDLQDLKSSVLDALTAKDHWQATPDARSIFAEFLGVPPERLPAPVEMRPELGAMFTKARNEAGPTRIPGKEFMQVSDNAREILPQELRELTTAAILANVKDGSFNLDQPSRRRLTRDVAEVFGDKGPDDALMLREQSDLKVSSARAYLHQVIASGGSFEEIIFALLLLLAEKSEKKALDLMEEFDKMDREDEEKKGGPPGRPGRPGGPPVPVDPGQTGGATPPVRPDKPPEPGEVKPPEGDKPQTPFQKGDVKKLATDLEAMVQSAHHMVAEKSDGGTQITVTEASRLTSFLRKMPKDVQKLLAGSIEKALQVGSVPITGNAHYALDEWAGEVLGRPFDLSAYAPGKPPSCDSVLARKLRKSEYLEDRIASFLVETLYQPDISLKEKMAPFKSIRGEVSEMAAPADAAPTEEAAVKQGMEKQAEEILKEAKAKEAGEGAPAADAKAAAEGAPATDKPEGQLSPDELEEMAGAAAAAPAGDKPSTEQLKQMMTSVYGPEYVQQMEQALGPEKMDAMLSQAAEQLEAQAGGGVPPMGPGGKPPLGPDGKPLQPWSIRPDDGSVASDTSFDQRAEGAGRGGKKRSRSTAQHELQMAINERQRTLDLLSNIMKAMHDTMMTSIRNIR